MKNMKRLSALFMASVIVLGLAACGTEQPSSTEAPETVQTTAATEPAATEAPATTETEPEFTEEFPPIADGCNQLVLYWHSDKKVDINTSDVWIWWGEVAGKGYTFLPCEYGFKCVVNVPEDITEVGFIVRTGCSDPGGSSWGEATKDYDGDRFAIITGKETHIYLLSGDSAQYYSEDGGKTLEQIRIFKQAGIISACEIRYNVSPSVRISDLSQIKLTADGEEVAIGQISSLGNKVVTGIITTAEPLDVTKNYELYIEGYGSKPVMPTTIFDSQDFIENLTYDGDDLGAVLSEDGKSTTFKLWAPTAAKVVLNLFKEGDGGSAYASVEMGRGEKGVWQSMQSCGAGTYYTYTVTTSAGEQEAVDPYAKSAGVNGKRGMVVDLDATDPDGWDKDKYNDTIGTYEDAVIWEVHVRDFSNAMKESAYPGKYLAFTETGLKNDAGVSVGIDYLKELGITHVHLQPVYDYASVDESTCTNFNWGYDPQNYNVPEGSYSTDPAHGEVRVKEFKEMVQGLHEAGLGVVIDVVYNHTYDANSNLNKVVPYYYYRYTASGDNGGGSGCGNETASERAMYRKYMVDSVVYWATEYHIDGFRFDLMALHDTETMQAIEEALHAINPKCLIYGEGWTGGTSELPEANRASQANVRKIEASEGAAGAVSVFNDAIRDGLKGSVFNSKDQGYINGNPTKENANKVLFGIVGGKKGTAVTWYVNDAGVINYMSCHDNLTLWDKLDISCPDATEEEKLAMQKLGSAIVLMSRGTPLFLAGEEMLRSKNGDENSYMSSDAVNNIRWDELTAESAAMEMAEYYRSLIGLRKEKDYLRTAEVSGKILNDLTLQVSWSVDGTEIARAYFNPNAEERSFELDGNWNTVFGGDAQGITGAQKLAGKGVILLEKAN
ncbi:MAG: type I pullulanase [Lachnospiraceae bacterium]|nr:type I pullulanase [Lachnospiraceae bacterium]